LADINNIIKFYRDCYQFENEGVKVNCFFTKYCELRFIPKTLELIQDNSIAYPISSEWGEAVESVLLFDSKEKELYAGYFLIKVTTKRIGV